MLILTRRPGEVVCIGSTHRVTMLEVQSWRARALFKVEQLPGCDCELKGFETEVALGINEPHSIAPDLEFEVLGIMGKQVRIGFTAPPDVEVDRAEVRERKDRGLPPPATQLGRFGKPTKGGRGR